MTTLFQTHASEARYHRSSGLAVACPCKTPEGFRDPEFHLGFKSYGPQSHVIASGLIPANTQVSYVFIGYGFNGMAMSPSIVYPLAGTISDPADFRVEMPLVWPEKPIQHFDVYRVVAGVKTYCGTANAGDTLFLDNFATVTGPAFVEPVLCNEAGEIPQNPVDVTVKAFVQPIQSTRATRLSTEYLQELFGVIEADDHLGIFPVTWSGATLKFDDWSQSGDDFIEYDGRRFYVVNANMIPDPGDGNPRHHWELGLRLLRSDGLGL